MDEVQLELRRLQNQNYNKLPISDLVNQAATQIRDTFIKVTNKKCIDYYSGALKPESLYTFQCVLEKFSAPTKVNYLEIGSAFGVSMSIIALILKQKNIVGELVSIDPYFEGGYIEGANGIWGKDTEIKINEDTYEIASNLYSKLEIDVQIIRSVSIDGLKQLIASDKKFNLIYVDGSHEKFNPLLDFALCTYLLENNGIIMLDDHYWPDVNIIKKQCDKYLTKIHECWKIAAYRWSRN